jgi:hypothetical protein
VGWPARLRQLVIELLTQRQLRFPNWRHSPDRLWFVRMTEPGHIALLVASGMTLIAVIALCVIVIRTTASMDRTTTRMGESLERMDRSATAAELAAAGAREAAVAAREAATAANLAANACMAMVREVITRLPPVPAE